MHKRKLSAESALSGDLSRTRPLTGFGPARVNTFTGKDDGGTSDALTFLTYNIEGLSTIYQPCVRSYISGFAFILLTETFSTCFPVHLFPLHDVFVSPGVRLTDSKTARLIGGVALLVRKKLILLLCMFG